MPKLLLLVLALFSLCVVSSNRVKLAEPATKVVKPSARCLIKLYLHKEFQERFLSVARFELSKCGARQTRAARWLDHKSAVRRDYARAPGKAAAAPEHGARRRYLHPRQWRAERLDMGLCRAGERRHPRVV